MSRNRTRLHLFEALRGTQGLRSMCSLATILTKGLCVILLVVGCAHHQTPVVEQTRELAAPIPSPPKRADFCGEQKSEDVRRLANWVVDSGDNHGMPFAILDKIEARVFVFDHDGRLEGAAPALLGLGKGDYVIPGIGEKKLSDIRPEDRVTEAGRFVSYLAINYKGTDILWLDYDSATSLHRVVTSNPKERRLERLASPNPLDHRISFGCINVPAKYFDDVVRPAFTGTYGIVYVLPETRSIGEIFKSYYDVETRPAAGTTANLDGGTRRGL